MPDAMRFSKPMLLERIRLAARVGSEPEQRRALAELARHHGDDPRLALILAEHWLATGERDRLFESISQMKWYLGVVDPGLLRLEAECHLVLGEFASAEAKARSAIAAEPGYEAARRLLVLALRSQHKDAELQLALREGGARFGRGWPGEIAAPGAAAPQSGSR
jgi:hypothetical protein